MSSHALIFANGSARDGLFVRRALEAAPDSLIVAADGGARMAYERFGLTPAVILGDLDSLSDEEQRQFRNLGSEIHVFPPEKDETDLEIALKWTVQQGYQSMRVIGALGRRIDQTFGNIYLLALPELTPLDVRFVSADQQLWLARPGQFTIEGLAGDTVSLIPIGGDTVNIQTEGLHYPLINETLFMGPARGISNVLDAECATISFETGLLLVVHTIGRAE